MCETYSDCPLFSEQLGLSELFSAPRRGHQLPPADAAMDSIVLVHLKIRQPTSFNKDRGTQCTRCSIADRITGIFPVSERERDVKMSMITRSDRSRYTELNQSAWALARSLSGEILPPRSKVSRMLFSATMGACPV